MLAYVYESKGVLRLTDRPVPEMPAGGAVMRVEAASICGTDVRAHRFGSDKIDAGRIIGHESAGILVSCDAPGFHPGDRVAVAPAIGCGVCRHCLAGRTNMCDDLHTIGFQYDGAFAEFLAIPAQAFRMGNVNAIPSGVDAGPYPPAEPLACVINAQSFLRIGPDDVVLIFGAGYIGCMHAWLARLAGAAHVIIAETAEGRIHEVRRLLDGVGAVNPMTEDVGAFVRAACGRPATVAVVACSIGPVQAQALALLDKGGRISLFGGLSGESTGFIDSNLIHYRELEVYGVHASTPAQNRQAIAMIREGRVDVSRFLSRYRLADIETAFADIHAGRVMKCVLEP